MRLIRYSEQPELWATTHEITHEVWPEYNQHGDVMNAYWGRVFDKFPDYQFVLHEDEVLGEGHTILKPVAHSLRITGTVAEWEQWTGMRFPGDGAYTFPGGLAADEIDHDADTGLYWEPNVWIVHAVENSS